MKKLLIVLGVLVAVIVGCSVASMDTDEVVEQTPGGSPSTTADNQVGPFEILGKVKPTKDFGHFAARFRVTNVSDTDQMAWFTVSVLNGQEIVGSLDCLGPNEVGPGRTATVTCTSVDKYRPGWTSIEVEHDGL